MTSGPQTHIRHESPNQSILFPELITAQWSSTFGKPRFQGVPAVIDESRSDEPGGILNGRSPIDVNREDTESLKSVGGWNRAVHVMKCLRIAFGYVHEQAKLTGPGGYDSMREHLPGFPNVHKITIYPYDKVQMISLVDTPMPMGDPSPLDEIAYMVHGSHSITLAGENKQDREIWVNATSLDFLERHHLLEKGEENRYAISGKELATIIAAFDEDSFYDEVGEYLREQEMKNKKCLEVSHGHEEVLTFTNNRAVKFLVNKDTGNNDAILMLDYYLADNLDESIYLHINTGELEKVVIDGERICTLSEDKGQLIVGYRDKISHEYVTEDVSEDSHFIAVWKTAKRISKRTRTVPDAIIRDEASALLALFQD